jgi:hypothetical protein
LHNIKSKIDTGLTRNFSFSDLFETESLKKLKALSKLLFILIQKKNIKMKEPKVKRTLTIAMTIKESLF